MFALMSLNESEILTSLRRFQAAHAAIDRAIEIFEREHAHGFWTAAGLLYRGRLELAERHLNAAVATLERSLGLLADKDPRYAAQARFALAQALVATSPPDRERAALLARGARATLGTDPSEARLVLDIDRWQREHALP
jgi:tetratricopeptide (TPR) repeat protein